MIKTNNNKLTQRVLGIIFSVFFLFLSAAVSLEAQTYGINWNNGNLTATLDLRDVVWTGTRFVAAGYNGKIFTSSNGTSWTSRSTPLGLSEHLFGIAYDGSNTLVAVGRDRLIICSEDGGTSWTLAHAKVGGTADIFKVAYGSGKFVAVDEGGGVWTSTDGKTGWSSYSTGYQSRVIRYGSGFFLIGASGTGGLYKSTSGNQGTWTKVGSLGVAVRGLCYGNSKWMAVGKRVATAGAAATSWTKRLTLSDYCFIDQLYSAVIVSGAYIAGGEHGLMLISADGITWRQAASGTKRFLLGMAFGAGVVAAVGNGGPRNPNSVYLYSTHYSGSGGTPPPVLTPGCSSLKVTAPNGGEQWEVGSSHNVTWTSSGSVGDVRLEYTTDGGKTYTVFDSVALNDGVRPWVVPDTPSTQCKVRITDTTNGSLSDTSNSTFSIVTEGGTPDGTITVTSPNGGESWEVGSSHDITWTSTGNVGNVKLEYSVDNGSNWVLFDGVALNDGERPWAVPDEDSDQCLIKITSVNSASIYDTCDAPFTIYSGPPPTITVTSPNGGESWTSGTGHLINWTHTGNISRVDIEYSTDNGSTWNSIETDRNNTGAKYWTVPDDTSTEAKVRVLSSAGSEIFDESDAVFTIADAYTTPVINITAPNGGESWEAGTSQDIKWTGTGTLEAVEIDYSVDNGATWKQITSYTGNDGTFSWTVPEAPSTHCRVRVTDQSENSSVSDTSARAFSITSALPAELALNRTEFNFAYALGGNVPQTQSLILSNAGGGQLDWTAGGDQTWLTVDPVSGVGSAVIAIGIEPSALALGEYTGTVTITDPDATNSPLTVQVNLAVIDPSQNQAPIGEMSFPTDGLVVNGSVPVTGWALDDIDVASLKLFYNQGSALGDAIFVDGARGDIEAQYPDYPCNYRAGWGYMLLTNSLPDGVYALYAVATDNAGKTTTFGPRTVTIDNASAVTPFGAIDFPAPGGEATGADYVNWGWALTPQPNIIPIDGSTVKVYVNGVLLGPVDEYNIANPGIAGLFPGLMNTGGPMAYFYLDTTQYANGVHQIAWTVADDVGNAAGIGSRFFSIRNSQGGASEALRASSRGVARAGEFSHLQPNNVTPLRMKNGYRAEFDAPMLFPDKTGTVHLQSREMERIVVRPVEGTKFTTGYMVVGDNYRHLPVGSTLDPHSGTFSWQHGLGFLGDYHLVLISVDQNGLQKKTNIIVTIHPK